MYSDVQWQTRHQNAAAEHSFSIPNKVVDKVYELPIVPKKFQRLIELREKGRNELNDDGDMYEL